MKTKVARWGNSLALRLPKKMAVSQGLSEGSDVEVVESGDGLVLRPIVSKTYRLSDLLAAVNEDNRHDEYQTGPAKGGEVW
ncbi:MAG: AbrB/MazE/SpoVT family DNA-binding domain-containing protein [Opitutaceae bacterium]